MRWRRLCPGLRTPSVLSTPYSILCKELYRPIEFAVGLQGMQCLAYVPDATGSKGAKCIPNKSPHGHGLSME
ncbi:hypothetical protein VFPPC_02845 [Pochonia chlamydosporia 170]|uniref:Uncharacterized protein n=1 Tax=Pochonia chlamydosporia 170 TaxID=1380566 RepID=A0A179FYU2_METCM|nr:hypothetical protein VFPPC_02845 [Pochonia chlamydosporia 170]OAQ70360.2 hypothetical protein VFPPC_02845 [Pochonia chlamydosporia 170]